VLVVHARRLAPGPGPSPVRTSPRRSCRCRPCSAPRASWRRGTPPRR
jgi:hypothetical protein